MTTLAEHTLLESAKPVRDCRHGLDPAWRVVRQAEQWPSVHGQQISTLHADWDTAFHEAAQLVTRTSPVDVYALLYGYQFSAADVATTFRQLAARWFEETGHLSSTRDAVMHEAYQQIIGLGAPVVPEILKALQTWPGQWFWALRVITREDPVAPTDRGNVRQMAAAWLEWGRQRGLI